MTISPKVLGWTAALGTVPYLTLKAMWLTGNGAGLTDPAVLDALVAANAVTFGLDLCVVALALALTHRWGFRLPAWLLLLPAWVATGLLVPIALVNLPVALLTPATSGPFEPWVQPMVYGGFTWQAVFLGIAFTGHVRARWTLQGTADGGPLLPVVTGGGVVMAGLSAGLYLFSGVPVATVSAVLTAIGAAGVLAVVRGRRSWWTVGAAWTGSAVMFAWGLYGALLAATGGLAAFVSSIDPVTGLASLTGLLGGFALAVAGLLALVPARSREMTPSAARR